MRCARRRLTKSVELVCCLSDACYCIFQSVQIVLRGGEERLEYAGEEVSSCVVCIEDENLVDSNRKGGIDADLR